jgi:cyclase
VSDNGLVKTTRFENHKYVGDPTNAIRIFNEKEVDELTLLDISRKGTRREPNFDLVETVASECFMPLSYGGGIRGLEDVKRLLSLGVDKVILHSAAARDPKVISEIANHVGVSSVVVSVDIKRSRLNRPQIYCPGSKIHRRSDWREFLQQVIGMGAGEIVLNAVNRDGTMTGMDIDLISEASRTVNVPLVAVGGVGSLDHILEGLRAGADAIGVGAFFVYHGPRRAVLITYPGYEDLSALLGEFNE